jgi:hypothetical protein
MDEDDVGANLAIKLEGGPSRTLPALPRIFKKLFYFYFFTTFIKKVAIVANPPQTQAWRGFRLPPPMATCGSLAIKATTQAHRQ